MKVENGEVELCAYLLPGEYARAMAAGDIKKEGEHVFTREGHYRVVRLPLRAGKP